MPATLERAQRISNQMFNPYILAYDVKRSVVFQWFARGKSFHKLFIIYESLIKTNYGWD